MKEKILMYNNYRIIALMGKAGSGKDTLLNTLISEYPSFFCPIISTTTRPKRQGEQEGVSYYYINEDEFRNSLQQDKFLEYTQFNGWLYGTYKENLSKTKINVGIFNPTGIRSLMKNENINLTVYYITCPDKVRMIRQLNRESDPDVEEIIRRFNADKEDFKNLEDINYISLLNNKKSHIKLIIRRILDNIN